MPLLADIILRVEKNIQMKAELEAKFEGKPKTAMYYQDLVQLEQRIQKLATQFQDFGRVPAFTVKFKNMGEYFTVNYANVEKPEIITIMGILYPDHKELEISEIVCGQIKKIQES